MPPHIVPAACGCCPSSCNLPLLVPPKPFLTSPSRLCIPHPSLGPPIPSLCPSPLPCTPSLPSLCTTKPQPLPVPSTSSGAPNSLLCHQPLLVPLILSLCPQLLPVPSNPSLCPSSPPCTPQVPDEPGHLSGAGTNGPVPLSGVVTDALAWREVSRGVPHPHPALPSVPPQSLARWESENKMVCEQRLLKGDGPKTGWSREMTNDGELILVSRNSGGWGQRCPRGEGWDGEGRGHGRACDPASPCRP